MNYGKNASTISALRTDTIILYLHFILFCWTTEIKQKFCNEIFFFSIHNVYPVLDPSLQLGIIYDIRSRYCKIRAGKSDQAAVWYASTY